MPKRRVRRRLVRRLFSERYILIVLVTFTFSVSLTRLFLEITGYPKLVISEIHIAHVLWGGLILFAGSLLPLIFVNKRTLDLSALLSGIGMGLFIDEVGKFLTPTNDYFYPAAAPIIYSFILITILLYIIVKRDNKADYRAKLFHVMEQFEEILERDLSQTEYSAIKEQLANLDDKEMPPHFIGLKRNFSNILDEEESNIIPHTPDILEKIQGWWLGHENKFFSQRTVCTGLLVLWLFAGLLSMTRGFLTYIFSVNQTQTYGILAELVFSGLLSQEGIQWTAWFRIIGDVFLGFSLISAILFARIGKYKLSLNISFFSLVFQLVLVNIFVFYYEQFSAIVFTVLQFAALFVTTRYRDNFKKYQK